MRRRLPTTILLWPVVGLAVGLGGIVGGQILLLAIALGVAAELSKLLKKQRIPTHTAAMVTAVGLMLAGHLWGFASIGTSLGLISLLLGHVKAEMKAIPASIVAAIIVAGGLGSLNAIAQSGSAQGVWQAIWVIAVIKLSDAGAYLFGTHLGSRPLLPVISPAKTVEGFIGALLSGGIIGLLGAPLFSELWFGPCLGVVLALVGSTGDMVESFLKRRAHVKDSGRILPGIGGLLDLCDSLIFGAPVAYVAIKLLSGSYN